ncbi:ABC transporter ATP-binding protein [Carnobacteriaceae bacterium zg-84]|uniref:ATP-binding cassette domain-containing protein n=1 Tax=Granulicatella sp. zg-84 TaxID=2678503 RepID=UPI0013BFAFD5|nr:ABC transporter ATP-binding protein [Granulicatella sp. zg-84]NEW65822.1 ATP-binding cassette domain-containing protein [Granulicatella sp. zg-84]QMI86326.1 ABC transporter ATP-binding protein [Carnobacteriaceae bacterium zg-84]
MKICKYIGWQIIVVFLVAVSVNSGMILMRPLLMERLLNIKTTTLTMNTVLEFLVYGLILYTIFYSSTLLANFVSNHLQRRIQIVMKTKLLKSLFLRDEYMYDEKVSILTQDMENLYEHYFLKLDMLIARIFSLIVTVLFILCQDIRVGLMFISFSILRPVPHWLMNKKIQSSGAQYAEKQKNFHLKVGDYFKGVNTIFYNGAQKEQLDSILKSNEMYENARLKADCTTNLTFFFTGPIEFIGQVLPLALGLFLQTKGVNITSASLVSMYIATMSLNGPIQTMLYGISDIQRSKVVRDKIFSLLETENKEYTYSVVKNLQELCVVDLEKQQDNRVLFKDVSFTLKKTEKMLIKGSSGSGKTTLLNMIASKESVENAQVFVRDTKGNVYTDYLGNVAYLSQQPFFMNASIEDNLTLGQHISKEKMLYFLKIVGLTEEIPDILEYQLRDNGNNLSGGQKLRLELVRFLIRDKDIVLADEITAALDRKNAKKVRHILYKLPIILIEVAHHIEDDTVYKEILDLDKGNK